MPDPVSVAAHRREWIAALRSGKYAQGSDYLRQIGGVGQDEQDRFCCMGVAADILGATWTKSTEYEEDAYWVDGDSSMDRCYLKSDLCEQMGLLNTVYSDLGYPNRARVGTLGLSRLNDERGLTFEQIANELENHPELYFTDLVDTEGITC